jgi:DNA-binding phage protein
MPLTRDFKETVQARAKVDPAFCAGLYEGAVQVMLEGDLPTARVLLRDFVHATIGFPALADRMGVHEKSAMRMLGSGGNPKAENLLAILRVLAMECRLALTVQAKTVRRRVAVAKTKPTRKAPAKKPELRAAA